MPIVPPPFLIEHDYQRMIYELMYLSMQRDAKDDKKDHDINTHDHEVRKLVRIWAAVAEGRAVDGTDQEMIRKLYAKFEHLIGPDNRVGNPPEGYPGYYWPEGTVVHPIDHFMPEWAKNTPEVGHKVVPQ